MKVKKFMNKPITTPPNVLVKDAAEILTSKKIGSLIVTKNDEMLGIITETDLTRRVISKGLDPNKTLLKDVMTKEVIYLDPEETMEEAMHVMNENVIKKLPIVEDGKLVGIITTTDIIKITEKQLRENLDDLKRLNREKDDFIAIASHELKTPIATIKGFLQLLKNKDFIEDQEERENSLEILDKEINRLNNLITNILDFSRIDLNVMKMSFDKVDLYQTMTEIKKLTVPLIKDSGLKANYIFDKNLPEIMADEERLKQVLVNLISNSVKYTQEGKITVKVKKEDDYVHFTVKDTGIGIPEKEQEKIFERFYRVEGAQTKKISGAGIGLAICKELLTFMGGEIWLKSEVGEGSEFHFNIPINGPKNK
ncbi:MAG: CBS domain-containing protein [Candidatus Aenigmarchaeota archaeon]|nr:CBS domain-containing protein [Candidatus Aenigmarchaeota archaeon]